MRTHRLLLALLLAGCGGSSTGGPDSGVADLAPPIDMALPALDMTRPPLGTPINAPAHQWTWVDVPGSSCSEGTPTGIGVNPGDAKHVLVYFEGGGACWDYSTCFVVHFAQPGPYTAKEFGGGRNDGIFDRTDGQNPFKDWSFVFVPYCTGDLHGGDNVATYTSPAGVAMQYHHTGRKNIELALSRIAATWPTTDKIVVSGSSAGGYGSGLNYDLVRTWFPSGEGYLIDDSGPPLKNDNFPPNYLPSFYAQWHLGETLDPICPTCRDDISTLLPTLARLHPQDRMALLSSLQDKTIRTYLLLGAAGFQTALLDLAATVIDPLPDFHYFFVTGETHTMLGDPQDFTSQGVGLRSWLTMEVSDDPKWTSLKP